MEQYNGTIPPKYPTILVNDYNDEYKDRLRNILHRYKFDIEILPYHPYSNKTYPSAKGIYINYIKTENKILVPVFNQEEDDFAISKLSSLLPKMDITPILCSDLAKEGGLLHCVTWEQ